MVSYICVLVCVYLSTVDMYLTALVYTSVYRSLPLWLSSLLLLLFRDLRYRFLRRDRCRLVSWQKLVKKS